MSTAIGQTINDIITLRDDLNEGIIGLTDADFTTLEAFLITTPATVVPVDLEEIDDGQYLLSFTPTTFGTWTLHYVYSDPPVFREESPLYEVISTQDVVIITTGGTWTYTGDLTDPIQEVRFLIQDTDGDHRPAVYVAHKNTHLNPQDCSLVYDTQNNLVFTLDNDANIRQPVLPAQACSFPAPGTYVVPNYSGNLNINRLRR